MKARKMLFRNQETEVTNHRNNLLKIILRKEIEVFFREENNNEGAINLRVSRIRAYCYAAAATLP